MFRIAATLGLLLACAARLTAGPYDDLLKVVPPNANTLVLVNAKSAFSSPLARAEKWSDDYFKRYRAGVGFVPPESEAVVVASEVSDGETTVKLPGAELLAAELRRAGLSARSGRMITVGKLVKAA